MFRYAVVVLLINTYSCLGLPARNNPVSLAVSLQQLANQCVNKFISTKISENLNYCNESMNLHSKKEFMCLMFYDINRQLCESNLDKYLNDDASIKITEFQERKELCGAAQTWTFGNIQEYPEYTQLTGKIFKNQDKCIGACAVADDIVSDDSNYHCKYFKWGMDLLKKQNITENPKSVDLQHELKPLNYSITSTANSVSKEAQNDTNNIKTPVIKVSSPTSNVVASKKEEPTSPFNTDMTSNKIEKPIEQEPPKKELDDGTAKDSVKTIIERPISSEKEPIIDNANDNIKPQNADDEDPEDDEDHDDDGLSDPIGGDPDGDEQAFNSDPKIDLFKPKINEKRIESITSFNEENAQREIFPNAIPDTFNEDDDHFFPFFMTSIIVVVLLYILYHNKGKLTKVILGLIVEGRQSGRRRNSRGHAYRRLDTLEQAMSSNTAAPPSKIIY